VPNLRYRENTFFAFNIRNRPRQPPGTSARDQRWRAAWNAPGVTPSVRLNVATK
jgi:hypothetical protein